MRWIVGCLCVLMLVSCTGTRTVKWQHKTIAPEQWHSDELKCKRAADRELTQVSDYRATELSGTSEDNLRLYSVQKEEKKLVDYCMRKLGYVPIP